MEGNLISSAADTSSEAGWSFTRGSDLSPFPNGWRRDIALHETADGPLIPVHLDRAGQLFQRLVSSDGVAANGDVGMWRRLDCAGHWVDARDAVDRRALQDVISRRMPPAEGTTYPMHQDGYGGYPTLAPGTACTDTDGDGMPDEWESTVGLDARDGADGPQDADHDGYTNLEEYLNASDPHQAEQAASVAFAPPVEQRGLTPSTDSGPAAYTLHWRAEEMAPRHPFVIEAEGNATGAQVVRAIERGGREPLEAAALAVTLPLDTDYYLWVRLMGVSPQEDALYAGIDGRWDRIFPQDVGSYEWVRVQSSEQPEEFAFALTAGEHRVVLAPAESNVRVDALYLTTERDSDPGSIPPAPTIP
jgi:hypothetical protein